MRLIDADALEPHEVYFNYGCQRIVYMDDIDEMPTIDAEPIRHGKWIQDRLVSTSGGTYGVRRCSLCEAYYQDVGCRWNYCPHCGARMENDD